jgi:multiple sugar transport system substrate-binding protein
MYADGGYLPINKNVYTDSEFVKKNPRLKFYETLYKTGVRRPFLENYTNVSDILSFYINKAIKKEISVQEALKVATAKINNKSILVK